MVAVQARLVVVVVERSLVVVVYDVWKIDVSGGA